MTTEFYSKRWDNKHGFTEAEAEEKKRKVDEGHGVGTPTSKWSEAVIERDPDRVDGYRIRISTKE